MFQADHVRGKGSYIKNILDTGADLKLILLSTLVMLAFIYTPVLNETVLKLAFGVAMLFFIPGYAFVAAFYPKKASMGGVERTALSFGLSICIFPMIGMVLTYTPWGLRFEPLVVGLTAFTIALTLVASARRLRIPEEDRFSLNFGRALKKIKAVIFARRSGYDTALAVILILSVASSVITIGCAITMPQQREKFTEFYVLGPNHTADDYPISFNYGDTKEVIVGISNHEYRNVTYDLLVTLDNSINNSVLYRETIPVANSQNREMHINLTPGQNGTGMRLNFLLYADGDMAEPYRECHFAVDVVGSA